MAKIDVFGGGIFGLTIAYCCQKRGADVRLIDPRGIASGASGGLVGAMAPHTPDNWNDKKQFQFESLARSPAFWSEVDATSELSSGYARTGRLVAIEDERSLELANARVTSARRFWGTMADWTVVKPVAYGQWAPQSGTGFVSFDTLSARISPPDACRSLACAFEKLGGCIAVETAAKRQPDARVLATGYQGLADLSRDLGREIGTGQKGQAALLDFDARDLPHVFAQGLHFVPHENGTTGVGSTSETDWTQPGETDQALEDLIEKARRVLPCLDKAPVLQRRAGIRPRARKRTPLLGAHPSKTRTFIANGGFKIGFGVSVRVGEVMADLVLDGRNTIPDAFSVAANLA